jgi:hypothetical protein
MPTTSDVPAIPVAVACEIADVSRQVRDKWIKRKLVLGTTAGSCSLQQLLDLAAFAEMVGCVGFEEARLAWPQVGEACRARWNGDRLDVVVDLQLKHAVLACDDSELAAAVRHGRTTRTVDLRPRLTIVTEAFERVVLLLRATC